MKRSRACDDLVALAAEASNHNNNTSNSSNNSSGLLQYGVDTWTPFIEGPTHRFKRSRADVSSCCNSHDMTHDQGCFESHLLQFPLEMNDLEGFNKEVTWNSSTLSHSSVQDDDCLPLRRNSRENMLLRKKKQRIAEITNSFNDFGIYEDNTSSTRALRHHSTRPQSIVAIESPETPEPRILRGLCLARGARCIDPLDKRQAQSFDMSALIMLSMSPKR
ncbi:unnamed protein product [Peronospora belbahrii]|uniref:Uncharacterized protein n=1 Tax=Peronospora belbahrii TaxID=622444 RepID=A0ABN8CZL1_9STRA|nr:unnamed protein product [Peronospora belbahrii]